MQKSFMFVMLKVYKGPKVYPMSPIIISINGTKNKHTKIINILLYIMDLNFSIMVVIDFSDIFVLVIEGEEEAPSR